jgi:hypothetical protein
MRSVRHQEFSLTGASFYQIFRRRFKCAAIFAARTPAWVGLHSGELRRGRTLPPAKQANNLFPAIFPSDSETEIRCEPYSSCRRWSCR